MLFFLLTIYFSFPECGRSFVQTHSRVANDSKTMSGDWPWVVFISVDNNGETSFICGGTVLNTHTVITAAHCLTGPFVSNRTLILHFGKHRFGDQGDDNEVLVRRVSSPLSLLQTSLILGKTALRIHSLSLCPHPPGRIFGKNNGFDSR